MMKAIEALAAVVIVYVIAVPYLRGFVGAWLADRRAHRKKAP